MKVLLIDDHPLILSALRSVIRGLGDDVTVVSAGSAGEARKVLARDAQFDLVLLDLGLGDASGFEVLTEFRGSWPALPVVIVSASDRASDVIRAIDLGAMGFVPKRAATETLFEALRMVMAGGIYVPQMQTGIEPLPPGYAETEPAVMRRVGDMPRDAHFQPHAPKLGDLGLTPRQTDVLGLLLQGQPNKLIARELGLSIETVKDHVAAVLRALGVHSRTQAVLAVSHMTQRESLSGWKRTNH